MLDLKQLLPIGLQYVANNPQEAMLTVVTAPPVRAYVLATLSEPQQEFLSVQLMRDPAGLLRFLQSPEGRKAAAHLVEAYRQQHLAAIAQPTRVTILPG